MTSPDPLGKPSVGPIEPAGQPPATPSGWAKVGNFIGYVFKTILYLPVNLVHLIVRISKATIGIFRGSPQQSSSATEHDVVSPPVSKPEQVASTHKIGVGALEENKPGQAQTAPATQAAGETATSAKPVTAPVPQPPVDPKLVTDFVKETGAVVSASPPAEPVGVKPTVSPASVDKVEQEFLELVEGMIKPAQDVIAKLRTQSAASEGYSQIVQALKDEYKGLKGYAPRFYEMPPAAQKLARETMSAVEKTMTDLGIMERWGDEILQPVETAFKAMENKQPVEVLEYLTLREQILKLYHDLEPYAGTFEEGAPGVYVRIQTLIHTLERKIDGLSAEMCAKVKQSHQIHDNAGGGDCLFLSLYYQLNPGVKVADPSVIKYYRLQAVNYMRAHLKEFERDILEVVNKSAQAQESMREYARLVVANLRKNDQAAFADLSGKYEKKFGKKPTLSDLSVYAWEDQLEKKLGRKAHLTDYYFDCMENYRFWGMDLEVLALAEVFQRPILVFTIVQPSAASSKDQSKEKQAVLAPAWRSSLMAGFPKFRSASPLLLYYNGINHYQDLIAK